MTNYPSALDTDTSLPIVNNNLSTIGAVAINAVRSATFALETAIGTNPAGSSASLADRIGVSINPDGTIISSALTSLGLVTLPITNSQIIDNAGIPESKLALDYPTINLFNFIRETVKDVNIALGWISTSGIKLEPHLLGAIYRHNLLQIDVAETSAQYLNNVFRVNRNNFDAYTLINDINNELLNHEWSDGYVIGAVQNIITNSGAFYPSNFAHLASGIYLNTGSFAVIPQTNNSVQSVIDYIDANSIFLLGTRIQNLYHNGISVNSRSSSLLADGYGQPLVSATPAIAYLKGMGNQTSPIDSITMGDDIIQFFPPSSETSTYSFDEQFSSVRVGDIIRVDYSGDGYSIVMPYVILETKFIPGIGTSPSTNFIVRIAGKNIAYAPNAIARIDRTLFNNNKYGVLSTSGVNTAGISSIVSGPVLPSLIIGNPRGAQCLGVNFSSDEFNETHYLLYLVLYPDGNPLDGYSVNLPPIDVTGNQGKTPGSYDLDSIVYATNNAFRQPGFNYRFMAFSFQGEFGIMLSDSYNNASFSIINGAVDATGNYNQTLTNTNYPFNVIDLFPTVAAKAPDPLGFGPFGSNVSSPIFQTTYPSSPAAQNATQIFAPLRRNNYYVNGAELEKMDIDTLQSLDFYGDGYWPAIIDGYAAMSGHITVSYQVLLDLSASQLKPGKTLVVQPANGNPPSGGVNYGRFIIQDVVFTPACATSTGETFITVYDGIHGLGFSPSNTAPIGTPISLYFCSDSVSFDAETATDYASPSPNVNFKRYFEVYIDEFSETFTHERARFSVGGNCTVNGVNLYNSSTALNNLDLINVSPTLRGYQEAPISKITLNILSFTANNGNYDGYLCITTDGLTFNNAGPIISGKLGEIVRFYDNSNIDYIDVQFPVSSNFGSFNNQFVDIQLFPTLELDQDVMLISTCQLNNVSQIVNNIEDERQFGNISTEELSTEALASIALPETLLHFNGIIRGFDITNIDNEFITINGGLALVNGVFQSINQQIITIPKIQEVRSATTYPINFGLCVNDVGELVLFAITDTGIGNTPTINRIITATNVVSSTTYQIDSARFSGILNDHKELTLLYIISSSISGTTVSLTSYDVRRYINDSDSISAAVLTQGDSQGNFIDLETALNWLKYNANYQSTLQVKGQFTLTEDPGLNFTLNIIGAGNNAMLTFSIGLNISNVVFTNVAISFANGTYLNNVIFDNCTITFETATLDNTVISNTSIVNINGLISNNTFAGSEVMFSDTTINVSSIAQAFVIGSGLSFQSCIFNNSYYPVGGSPAYISGPFDLINAGSGLMYANITDNLSNVAVQNCIFNNTYNDHFPNICLQLGGTAPFSYGAIAQNILISGNTFNSLNDTEDYRAVIAITSTITTATPNSTYPLFPKLVSAIIENNVCNYDQIILLSTVRNDAAITGAMLACTNCRISGNVCGTVGFITASDFVSNSNNAEMPNLGAIRDKMDQLIIEKNTCKLIINCDYQGSYIPFFTSENTKLDWVKVGTGSATISENTCNWILVGAASNFNRTSNDDWNATGMIISSNTLSPNNPIYLQQYQDNVSGTFPLNIGIHLRQDNFQQIDFAFSQSVITNNVMSSRRFFEADGYTILAYNYDIGIKCENSAAIVANNLSQVCNNTNSPSSPMILLFGFSGGGPIIRCSDNVLSRGANTISSYVQSISSNAINTVSITNNTFDSLYVDNGNTITNDTNTNIPFRWSYHHNTNQVDYVSIPIYECYTNAAGVFTTIQDQPFAQPAVQFTNTDINIASGTYDNIGMCIVQLSKYIPRGIQLMYGIIGFFENDSSSNFPGGNLSYFTLGFTQDIYAGFDVGSLSGSLVDVFGNYQTGSNTAFTYGGTAVPAATFDVDGNTGLLVSQNNVLKLDMSGSSTPIVINEGFEAHAWLQLFIAGTISSQINLIFSPLVVRFFYT